MNKNLILWIAAIVITLASAVYQRSTGPTYPVSGKVLVGDQQVDYKLIRTYGGPDNAEISIPEPTGNIQGTFRFKRLKSHDEWIEVAMVNMGGKLVAYVPHQPPAGKVEYQITLSDGTNQVQLTKDPVIIRFKGHVPAAVLIPHILFMFLAMLFATRTGIEAIVKGDRTFSQAVYTAAFLFLGGIILGPVVQKYAFGAYWTGWPMKGIFNFGDMTDNKTAVAMLFWILAVYMLWKNREKRGWALLAAIVLLLIYLIPHSMMGSEIDHTMQPPIGN
ncbi:MAG: hypothetical protein K0B15_11740 [Lentimicrobium sp.]|nr:hypothetical protein [Lentimicrobium sp.]